MTPNIVIFGHTHKSEFQIIQNTLYINPGSAAKPKIHQTGSVAILNLNAKKMNPKFFKI
jgi:putative phosphoesterase